MPELEVVIAIRPADVVALIHPQQLLRRLLGALLDSEQLGPVLSQLVAAVLRGPELTVRREGHPHRVANPGCVARPARLGLTGLGGVEAPDSRPGSELGAGRSEERRVGKGSGVGWGPSEVDSKRGVKVAMRSKLKTSRQVLGT